MPVRLENPSSLVHMTQMMSSVLEVVFLHRLPVSPVDFYELGEVVRLQPVAHRRVEQHVGWAHD